MTDKPIITIPVDDSKFKAFLDLFEGFKDDVKELPASFADLYDEIEKGSTAFEKSLLGVTPQLEAQAAHTTSIVRSVNEAIPAQAELAKVTDRSAVAMKKLSTRAGEVAKGVFGASASMSGLKKALGSFGPLGIGAGVLAGAAFGLGDLALKQAQTVTGTARTAFGANLGYGQYQNATAQLSPFVPHPGALLQNVAAAQWNPATYGMLSLYGVNSTESPLSASAKIIRGSVEALRRSHNLMLPTVSFGQNLTGLSQSDMISLVNQKPGNLDAAIKAMLSKKLAAQQNVSGSTISKDQRLTAGWAASMNIASAKFAAALAPMNPIVQSFGNDVAKFAGAVNNMVQGVVGPSNGSIAHGGTGSPAAAVAASKGSFGDALTYALTGKGPSSIYPIDATAKITRKFSKGIWYNLTHPGKTLFGSPYNFSAPEKKYGLPRGLLRALGMTESSLNAYAVSPKGAQGLFQFMPPVAASLGINPFDPGQSAYGAGYEMNQYLSQYKGNLRKAVAAYNWGSGNLDKDIKAHGSSWEQFAPKETRNEISKVLRLLAQRKSTAPNVSLNISNSTSARVAMSSNSAAY